MSARTCAALALVVCSGVGVLLYPNRGSETPPANGSATEGHRKTLPAQILEADRSVEPGGDAPTADDVRIAVLSPPPGVHSSLCVRIRGTIVSAQTSRNLRVLVDGLPVTRNANEFVVTRRFKHRGAVEIDITVHDRGTLLGSRRLTYHLLTDEHSETAQRSAIADLGSANEERSQRAMSYLSLYGDLRCVNHLTHVLASHRSPQVRAGAARTLGLMHSVDALKQLVDALADPNWDVRVSSSTALLAITSQSIGIDEVLADHPSGLRLVQARWRKWIADNEGRLRARLKQ